LLTGGPLERNPSRVRLLFGADHRSDDHDGVEDKTFPKDTSPLAGGGQDLVRIEEFQGKIAAARAGGSESDLLAVARTEALIADLGLRRGAEAGSCLLRIRSRYDPFLLQAKKHRRS
jgi:hypothetical protein